MSRIFGAVLIVLFAARGFAVVRVTSTSAPSAMPATTRAAEDVEIKTVAIDPGATLITGKVNEQWADRLFGTIAEQAKLVVVPQDGSLNDPPLDAARFSAEWDRQPLWAVINEACESTGLRAANDTSGNSSDLPSPRLLLLKGPFLSPASIDGPAMLRAIEVTRTGSRAFGGEHRPEEVSLTIQVLLEPRFRRCAFAGRPVIEEAKDDRGHSLVTTRPASDPPPQPSEGIPANVTVPLLYPKDVGQRIAVIRGTVPLLVANNLVVITLHRPFPHKDEIAVGLGADQFIFRGATRDDGGWFHVSTVLKRGAHETDEHFGPMSRAYGSLSSWITCIGPKGTSYANGAGAGSDRNEGRQEATFNPREADDQPTEIRVEIPIDFAPLTAKFEFKDIPMP